MPRGLSARAEAVVNARGAAQVWAEVTALARQPGVVDLGQGWPDFGLSAEAAAAARDALDAAPGGDVRPSQYTPVPGSPQLRDALRSYERRTWGGEGGGGATDFAVTTSGTEALLVAFQALLGPGDECVVVEPSFPWYKTQVELQGATAVPVTLAKPAFALSEADLRAAVSSRTKVLVVNTPHNPTGRVLDDAELGAVAAVARDHDLWVVSDEVYERQTFGGRRHRRVADLPGMRERTLTVGSAGKLFACTGWRVGWVSGPPDLVSVISTLHGYLTYCAPAPLQLGVAAALESASADPAKDPFTVQLEANARELGDALRADGVEVFDPEGGYFLVASTAPLGISALEYVKRLGEVAKVVAVPMSVFYCSERADETLVRFAVCKRPDTIREAAKRVREAAAGTAKA